MKKNTISALLLAAGMSFGINAFGQTAEQKLKIRKNTDTERLHQLAQEFKARYEAKKAEADKQADLNGWPKEIKKDGKYSILVDVADGKPIYLSTHNIGSAITSRTNYLQPGGGLNLNLTGENMTVGMWDGGHPLLTHNDLKNRILPGDAAVDDEEHPTHVVGTMIGNGSSDANAKGMAPKAVAYVYTFDGDGAEMAAQAESEPLLLSNHSYGYNASEVPSQDLGAYLSEAKETDEILFAAKNYLPVFSAGNDGDGTYDKLTDRTLAKNALVVGAVQEVLDYTGPASVQLASFSSWGPTNDNRIKPDIVTKGVHVYSSINTNNSAHGYLDGTSMSSPGVTGSLLLIQQYYGNGQYMLSSTLRGLVAHTADECGPVNAPGPDAKFGWGLLNCKAAAETITNNGTTSLITEKTLFPGDTYTFSVRAAGGDIPLKATLAWIDPPANTTTTNSARLINDLDIRVTKGGNTFYPWKLPTTVGGNAITGDNKVDNIEKVEINTPETDWYTITISHKGTTLVNPGTGEVPSQQYSIIVTGITDITMDAMAFQKEIFSIWPNPAVSEVNITLSRGLESNASASIIDIQGRQVRNVALVSEQTIINTVGLAGGVYFVKVENGKDIQTKKLVIK